MRTETPPTARPVAPVEPPGGKTMSPPAVAGFVVLLLAAIGVVAWQLWPRTSEVVVVGDSVTVMTKGALGDRVSGSSLQFVAEIGYSSSDLLPLFEHEVNRREATSRPLDRVALLVGYNDLMHGEGAGATEDLDRMVELSSRFECGVWLTLPGAPGGGRASDPEYTPERVEEWNAHLARQVGRHPNLHLVRDWEETVDAGAPQEYLDPDGIHPAGPGREALAEVYAEAIDRYC